MPWVPSAGLDGSTWPPLLAGQSGLSRACVSQAPLPVLRKPSTVCWAGLLVAPKIHCLPLPPPVFFSPSSNSYCRLLVTASSLSFPRVPFCCIFFFLQSLLDRSTLFIATFRYPSLLPGPFPSFGISNPHTRTPLQCSRPYYPTNSVLQLKHRARTRQTFLSIPYTQFFIISQTRYTPHIIEPQLASIVDSSRTRLEVRLAELLNLYNIGHRSPSSGIITTT